MSASSQQPISSTQIKVGTFSLGSVQYEFNGLAGCVIQRKSRATGRLVGLYQSHQAGMESDPALPWATVCETHGVLVCHSTLILAGSHLSDPQGWCEQCRSNQ